MTAAVKERPTDRDRPCDHCQALPGEPCQTLTVFLCGSKLDHTECVKSGAHAVNEDDRR